VWSHGYFGLGEPHSTVNTAAAGIRAFFRVTPYLWMLDDDFENDSFEKDLRHTARDIAFWYTCTRG
jgi:hypothetical protein